MPIEIRIEPKIGEKLTVTDTNRLAVLQSMLPYIGDGYKFTETAGPGGSITYALIEMDAEDE